MVIRLLLLYSPVEPDFKETPKPALLLKQGDMVKATFTQLGTVEAHFV